MVGDVFAKVMGELVIRGLLIGLAIGVVLFGIGVGVGWMIWG